MVLFGCVLVFVWFCLDWYRCLYGFVWFRMVSYGLVWFGAEHGHNLSVLLWGAVGAILGAVFGAIFSQRHERHLDLNPGFNQSPY